MLSRLLVAAIRLWRRRAHRKCLARIERLERELLPHLFPPRPRSVKVSDVVYVGLTGVTCRCSSCSAMRGQEALRA